METSEVERAELFALIEEKMKEAKAGLIPLEKRKELAEDMIYFNNFEVGDPLLEKLADFVLADDIANKDRLKMQLPDSWLTDRQMERRLAGETEFREFT
ncbi:hypothetical protein ACRW9N_13150 [Listeria aquatica]|uniref:hypothetical protein n=1 Tax=Listeria aquatica TaxID=1494960 RepID=UPI003EF52FF8